MIPALRPLRVLMTTDAVGGVWVYASALARELARRGHKVTLVTLGPAPREDQLTPLRNIGGIDLEITDLALEWQDPRGSDQQRATGFMTELEQRLRPDVVHLNGYREALAGWRAPVLVAAHSCVRSWARACRGAELSEPEWAHYGQQVAASLNSADCWVAPSAAARDMMTELYAPQMPGRMIWNGSDAVAGCGAAKQRFILAAGRLWDEAKNIGILPEAAREVAWPLRIAGALHQSGGDPSIVPLASGLEWLGDLPHAELMTAMRAAGIFVSPAVYEPFGLTVLEAARAGCALVLADIPTFRELWDGAALFVDPRDSAAIGKALKQLSQHDAAREKLQAQALARSARYSLGVMAGAHEALYAEMLRQSEHLPLPSPLGAEAIA